MTATARVRSDHRPARGPASPLLAALALAMLLSARTASAAPIPAQTASQTKSIALTATDWKTGSGPLATNPLAFAKFNPALGTLLSVTISGNSTFEHQVNMTFVSPSLITVTSFGNAIDLGKPDGTSLTKILSKDDIVAKAYAGPTFPQDFKLDPTTTTGTSGPLKLTAPGDLAMFTAKTAAESFTLPALSSARSSFTTNSGNGFGGVNTRAGVGVTVTFEFAPVPEPSTLAVLGLGAAVLLATRRRLAS